MNYGGKVAATPTRNEVSRIQIKCCREEVQGLHLQKLGSLCAYLATNKQHA